jgi:ribosomal-protein-alanine N-acetyltransferase
MTFVQPDRLAEVIPTIDIGPFLLRPLLVTDVTELFETYADAEAMKFRANPPMTSLADAMRMVTESHEQARNRVSIRWGIEFAETHTLIGTFIWKIGNHQSEDEIGYSLNKRWWNRGLMTDITRSMVTYLHEREHVHTLRAITDPENYASIRLLEKIGFTQSGNDSNGKFVFRNVQSGNEQSHIIRRNR